MAVSGLVFGKQIRVACDYVKSVDLKILLVQKQVLVLTVDIEKAVAQIFEQRCAYRGVIDESTAFT